MSARISPEQFDRIEGMRQSITADSQRLQAQKTWLGSEGVNVLQVLCDFLDLMLQMNIQLANHKHGPTPPPDNSSFFIETVSRLESNFLKLSPITL